MALAHAEEPPIIEHPTSTGLDSRKLAMWAFLASDCMFFGSLIATYMVSRNRSVVGPYPDEVLNIPYTSVSAFVLLMSSLAMVLALAGIQRGNLRVFRVWTVATGLLGLVFLAGQVFEFTHFWRHEHLTLHQNLFGSSFFVLTGFHGTHVALGVVWLFSLFLTSLIRPELFTPRRSLNVEIAGLYWHFVDIVWIIIFTLVYLLPYE